LATKIDMTTNRERQEDHADRKAEDSSNGVGIFSLGLSTFSWVFCQGGVWMAMEVKVG